MPSKKAGICRATKQSRVPMPLMKANEVLELVIDYQRDIFTVVIIDRMEEYHRKISLFIA